MFISCSVIHVKVRSLDHIDLDIFIETIFQLSDIVKFVVNADFVIGGADCAHIPSFKDVGELVSITF